MITLDPTSQTTTENYKLLIGSIVPRPIAFVSTVNAEGQPNLAPFSFFTGVCSTPLTVCFCPSIRGSDGQKKDTLKNIEVTKEFVIQVVTEDIAEGMNVTAGEYPSDVSEFEAAGFTPIASIKVTPPRVKESPIQMECVLSQIVTIAEGVGGGAIVIGTVVAMHIDEALYSNGRIDTALLKPVGRLAGSAYARVTDVFEMARSSVKAGGA